MTSIKQYMDELERAIARSALSAYAAALTCVGKETDRALPGLKGDMRSLLDELAGRLGADAGPSAIEECRTRFEFELDRWADLVIEDLDKKTSDAKELMLTLVAAAERISERDSTNSSRFSELTTRLQSIGTLDDISAIRRQLSTSVFDMKANIQRMDEEGRATVLDLQTQIEAYRAQALESERRATTDQLTGVRNRRGLEVAIESRRESRSSFSVILLDLNGFKEINDTYGHPVGDELLRLFANELRDQFASADIVGRWGGDEFVVVTYSTPDEVATCLNRVRRWVLGKYKVQTSDGMLEIGLDAAIGVAEWDLQEDSDRLLARADSLMYAEKRAHV
ncbi:MAG TPA: GGDEF domain-containing protein [Bryobacteraceae bacterium]|jgi:diguanylate cyclase (GGDEF)-like protein|nr:GGDEF domain-containing protein [Bryobacteraceae bacterium]